MLCSKEALQRVDLMKMYEIAGSAASSAPSKSRHWLPRGAQGRVKYEHHEARPNKLQCISNEHWTAVGKLAIVVQQFLFLKTK